MVIMAQIAQSKSGPPSGSSGCCYGLYLWPRSGKQQHIAQVPSFSGLWPGRETNISNFTHVIRPECNLCIITIQSSSILNIAPLTGQIFSVSADSQVKTLVTCVGGVEATGDDLTSSFGRVCHRCQRLPETWHLCWPAVMECGAVLWIDG